MKNIFFLATIIAFLIAFCLESSAQLDSAALVSEKLYMSLNDAFQEPDKVRKLCLGGQELKEIPEGLAIFKNLQEVNMSQNYLVALPEDICFLPILEEIKLSGNELKSLPEKFMVLQSLRRLDLSVNPGLNWKIELIKISRLANLEYLDLSYNDIESIPDSFAMLKSLKELNLSGNNLTPDEKEKIKKLLPNTRISFD